MNTFKGKKWPTYNVHVHVIVHNTGQESD
jgi:hypothetical protein